MSDPIKSGWAKSVRYINTPLHFFALCFIGLVGVLFVFGYLNFPPFSVYIILSLLGIVIVAVVLLLVIAPKKLQFTAEELIAWKRMELGDSSSETLYTMGPAITAKSSKMIPDKRKREKK